MGDAGMAWYHEVSDLSRGHGKLCSTLGELVECVIAMISDDSLLVADRDRKKMVVEPHRWWFRGACHEFKLNSKLFRATPGDLNYPSPPQTHGRLEQLIKHEYSQMTRGRFFEVSDNQWDRLFEMQHYGLPTRLLDWSINLGQAIWFSLQPPRGSSVKHEPVIWILNPRLLAKASLGEPALNDFAYLELHGKPQEMAWGSEFCKHRIEDGSGPGWILSFLMDHPTKGHFPILPSWTNPRLAAQMGCFTLQSGVEAPSPPLDDFATEAVKRGYAPFLYKIRLEPEAVATATKALSFIGVNEYTLFPELHGTCAWINQIRNFP